MPSAEESRLILNMDKKLDILISKVEIEIDANKGFKTDVKAEVSQIQDRIRVIELWKSKMEVNQDDFKLVKQSIIRWVVSGMLTSVIAALAIKLM